MKNRSVVFAVGLALLVADSAMGAVGVSTPSVPFPSLPPLPPVAPRLPPAPPVPSVPAAPSVPSVPQVSVPQVPQLPAVPAVRAPAPGGSQSRGAPSVASGQGAGSRRGAPARSGASPAGAARARAGGSSGSRAGTAPARRSASGSGRAAATPRPGHERRLRAAVRRLEGCLDGVSALERRVLVLRAGLGERPPRTRARVARVLELSRRRVARLERRGLRSLRALARAGRCGSAGAGEHASAEAPAGDTFVAAGLRALVTGGSASGPVAAAVARGVGAAEPVSAAPRERIEVKAEHKSSGGAEPVAAPPASAAEPVGPRPPGAIVKAGGADLTLPLLIVAAVGALLLAARAVRRTLRSGPPA